MLSILYYILMLLITLVFFVVICVVWALTVLFDKDRVVVHWLSGLWTSVYFGLVPTWRRKVQGRENIEKGKAYVVIVNHRSMLDIPLMYVLPLRFKWVSKKEVYKWPLFGWVLWMHDDIAIERGSAVSLRKMMARGEELLGRGVSVIIFPEGTRGSADAVGRFREGAFVLAREAGVEILPCVSVGTGTAIEGWKLNFRNRFKVNILPPVSVERVRGTDPKQLAAELQKQMSAEYEKMKREVSGVLG